MRPNANGRRLRPAFIGIVGCTAGVVAGLVPVAAPPAAAVEGAGAVNTVTTAVPPLPGTTRNVDAWKLAGIPGNNAASGSQIAPQWIVTAHHNAPGVGTTFKNALGSAKVDATFAAPGAPNSGGGYSCESTGGPDISFSHLATPIAAPAGGYPSLLSDALPDSDSLSALPGYALSAGEGGFTGYIKAVWTTTGNTTVADPTQVASAIGGDSGGASYWYPSATSTPILANVIVYAGRPFGQATAQFAGACGLVPDIRAWTTSVFSHYPSAESPSYVSLNSVAPPASRRPFAPASATIVSTSSTTAYLNWVAPPAAAGTPAVTGYEVRLQPGNIVVRTPALLNTTVTGLTPNTTYTATVAAVNSNGVGALASVYEYDNIFTGQFVTSPAPDALTAVSYEPYTYQDATTGALVGCVHIDATAATTGVQGRFTGAVSYALGNTPQRSYSSTNEYCHLPRGQQVPIFVSAYNELTPGPAKLIWVTAPTVVTGAPLSVHAAARVTTLSTGAKSYIVDAGWTAPNGPTLPATLKSYQVTIFDGTNDDVSYWKTYRLAADQTNWSAVGLRPNTKYYLQITGNYDRTVPNQAAAWITVTTPA
ncbi:fibronectin type III domain protein [Jatrophihabitans sp. GAS493]|uniref:fibronectin type III domain-containing protein n=1 Tax=Jatrophihabitans sp. GAS493 TaxID=1907575 RepID=UPI000BBFFC68|nr:fibronectin type III domain-containing protein [Jatrophihabitans sp. GAS493]SOD75186.1 fibronectin type III domain protein [Jatrophihabitans sp. GAS493]